jgi:hypothetical protein
MVVVVMMIDVLLKKSSWRNGQNLVQGNETTARERNGVRNRIKQKLQLKVELHSKNGCASRCEKSSIAIAFLIHDEHDRRITTKVGLWNVLCTSNQNMFALLTTRDVSTGERSFKKKTREQPKFICTFEHARCQRVRE